MEPRRAQSRKGLTQRGLAADLVGDTGGEGTDQAADTCRARNALQWDRGPSPQDPTALMAALATMPSNP